MSQPAERMAKLYEQMHMDEAADLEAIAAKIQAHDGPKEFFSNVQTPLQRRILDHFADVESLKPERVLPYFARDAVFEDPHYPNPRMRGIDQIAEGIEGALKGMERMSFTPVPNSYTESLDGRSAFVLMDTDHQLRGGPELKFVQGFFVQVNSEYRITNLKSLLDHPPGPPLGIVLGIRRLAYRLTHRGQR